MKPAILCIEDNLYNGMFIRRVFRPESYFLMEAENSMRCIYIQADDIQKLWETVGTLVPSQYNSD